MHNSVTPNTLREALKKLRALLPEAQRRTSAPACDDESELKNFEAWWMDWSESIGRLGIDKMSAWAGWMKRAAAPAVGQEGAARTHSPGVLQSMDYTLYVLEKTHNNMEAEKKADRHEVRHAYNTLKAARDFPDLAAEAARPQVEEDRKG